MTSAITAERSHGSLSLLFFFWRSSVSFPAVDSNAIIVHRINTLQQTEDVASSSILQAAFLFIVKLPLMPTEEYKSARRNVKLYVQQGRPQSGVKMKKKDKICVCGGWR